MRKHTDDNVWVVTKSPSGFSAGERYTHCSACGYILQVETFELGIEEKNAIKKAESHLDFMSFSRFGLVQQLEYEGLTAEQTEYGVTAVGY